MIIHTFPASAIPRDVGDKLRELRLAREWSQGELARRSGVPRETINRSERAARKPSAETVLRLVAVLLDGRNDMELQNVVPLWPEAAAGSVFGHGPRSRVRRRELRLSLASVAAAAGVSPATLSRFERNAGPTPSLLAYQMTAHGDVEASVRGGALARALGFRDKSERESYCGASS